MATIRKRQKKNGNDYNRLQYEKNVQPCTLSYALRGNAVSKLWANTLCEKTKIHFKELFDEIVKKEPYATQT